MSDPDRRIHGNAPAPSPAPPGDARGDEVSASDRYDLEMAFSRGLHTGWFRGVNNQELVHARFGTKRGVFLGTVTKVENGRVALRLEAPLKPGDGVVFDAGRPDEPEEGGRIYRLESRGGETWVEFGRGAVDFHRVQSGDRIWKTSDPELDRRLRRSFAKGPPRFLRPLRWEVHGIVGQPLTLIARDELGHVVRGGSTMPLVAAERQPLDDARLGAQLGRLGGTGFRLESVENRLEGAVLIPLSELNRLRRDLVDQLSELRARPPRWTLAAEDPAAGRVTARMEESRSGTSGAAVELVVLVRDPAQLEIALRCGVETVYCEFEDPKRYRDAVRVVRESTGSGKPGRAVWVAPPRITKPGEEWILKQVRSCDADGYLVRNPDQLHFFSDSRRHGDFSLNVANGLTAEYFIVERGLECLTASYDLNISQLGALLRSAPPAWFEITLHQHMPMFHMEHCVFCAFLSNGTDYTNCGRPCDRHRVELRDRMGARHPLRADAGCRNTVFNALAQTGAEFLPQLLAWGARRFRIEFLNEEPERVARTISRYRELLRGEISGAQLWRELRLRNQLGVTRGQLAGTERGPKP